MNEPAIKLSPETEAAILQHLDAARRHTAVEAVENMLREIQAGNVEVLESECKAPPAADGEVTIEFKFRLRATNQVSSSPCDLPETIHATVLADAPRASA